MTNAELLVLYAPPVVLVAAGAVATWINHRWVQGIRARERLEAAQAKQQAIAAEDDSEVRRLAAAFARDLERARRMVAVDDLRAVTRAANQAARDEEEIRRVTNLIKTQSSRQPLEETA